MDLNSKDIQLQYEGFLNTPFLWNSDVIFGLKQLELPKVKLTKFNKNIAKNLRLGKRVERFISHELQDYSSIKILAENIQIQNVKITVGEIDFIIQQNNIPIHLEVMYKFYLYDKSVGKTELEHWIGPNRKDSFVEKLTKLREKQLPLLYKEQTKPFLKSINITAKDIQQQIYFKAQLFVPFQLKNHSFKLINNNSIKGFYISFDELFQFNNSKFYIPSKINWLQEIQIQINWLSFNEFSPKVETMLQNKTSPLCWLKQPNGEVFKFFIVWWN